MLCFFVTITFRYFQFINRSMDKGLNSRDHIVAAKNYGSLVEGSLLGVLN